MKNIKETDRIIRNKLRNHVVETPNHLWDKIEAKRGVAAVVQKSKPSRSKWLLLLLFLAVGGTSSWLAFNYENQPTSTADDAMSILETKKTIANKLNTAEKQINSIVDKKAEEVSIIKTQKTKIKKDKITRTQINKTNQAQKSSTQINKNKNRQISTYAPIATATSNATGIESMPNTAISAKTVITETGLGEESIIKDGSFLKDINYLPNEFSSLKAKPLSLGSLPDPKCAKFGNSSFGFDAYLDWYISPDYAFRTLEARDAEYIDDVEQRDKTESFLYAYSTGIRFSAVAENGLAFRSGVSYSQINEKFDYVSGSETRISIKNELDPDGNIISSDTTLQIGTHVKTSYNRYRMIDIPLILGYEVDTKHFVYSMNAGVYLNLLFTQKGDFLNDGGPVNFTSNRTDSYRAFKDKLGFSLFGSFGFNYKLGNHMQILIEPHVRYHLNPINNRDYKIDQSYITAGLITGVRFKF